MEEKLKPFKPKNSRYEYVKVKIEDGVWKNVLYHRYLWIQIYGDIPEGMQIHHKDKNPTNNDINNLELVDAFEHNSMHHLGVKYPNRKPHGSEPNIKGWKTRKARSAAKQDETNKSNLEGSTTNR